MWPASLRNWAALRPSSCNSSAMDLLRCTAKPPIPVRPIDRFDGRIENKDLETLGQFLIKRIFPGMVYTINLLKSFKLAVSNDFGLFEARRMLDNALMGLQSFLGSYSFVWKLWHGNWRKPTVLLVYPWAVALYYRLVTDPSQDHCY